MMETKLNVTISKTSDGESDYLQIMSPDMLSINIVLVATEIVVSDTRPDAE